MYRWITYHWWFSIELCEFTQVHCFQFQNLSILNSLLSINIHQYPSLFRGSFAPDLPLPHLPVTFWCPANCPNAVLSTPQSIAFRVWCFMIFLFGKSHLHTYSMATCNHYNITVYIDVYSVSICIVQDLFGEDWHGFPTPQPWRETGKNVSLGSGRWVPEVPCRFLICFLWEQTKHVAENPSQFPINTLHNNRDNMRRSLWRYAIHFFSSEFQKWGHSSIIHL